MRFSLLPAFMTEKLTDLTPEFLKQQGVDLLMLDFDNTIVPYTTSVATEEMDVWIKNILVSDLKVCVVSNSRKDRAKIFCSHYGMDCITHAKKPFSRGIRQCLEKYQIPASRAALVGDQIFTDTLGGNGCGVRPILVKAIHNHTFWLKARHVLEMPFIFMARNRKIS